MSTIFKTRISQQEVQTPVVSTGTVVTDNFITSSIQSESVSSENINATIVQGEEIIANDLSTENIAISNDLSIGQDVIVPSGNVLIGRRGIVSFVDDGEEVDENGASGFPIYNGVPEILNNSTVYNIGEIDKDIDLSNIRFGGNDNMVQTCEIWFSVGNEAYDIYWPENMLWLDSTDGNAPAIVKGTEYRIVLRKENEQIVASIAYAIGEGSEIVSGNMMEGVARLDADNTFTAGNTFTGAVDMSAAQVTPPEGWNVGELTPEAIQAVAPISWSGLGSATTAGTGLSYAIGAGAKANGSYAFVGGCSSQSAECSVSIGGRQAIGRKTRTVTIGSFFSDTEGTYTCTTEGTGSITIGAGANTLNNGDTESSNSITIGCKASNKGADSVVIGAQASCGHNGSVVIGAGANTITESSVTIGRNSRALNNGVRVGFMGDCYAEGVSIGGNAIAYYHSTAIGRAANAKNNHCVAIGSYATVSDFGATVIRSTAEDGTYTQLYFSGANTPLANTYENGEAMMGYVVRDSAGNIMTDAEGNAMVGTQKLSVLFPNNRGENAFTPAMLGLDDEWTPKPMFRPSDLDLPQEEPTEPEEYQPLPVYPIVEPEIEEI